MSGFTWEFFKDSSVLVEDTIFFAVLIIPLPFLYMQLKIFLKQYCYILFCRLWDLSAAFKLYSLFSNFIEA